MNDEHTTLGEHFRTPSHPDVLIALGRIHYNFISLDETITALLYDSGKHTLQDSRAKMAGGKEKMLEDLSQDYSANGDEATASIISVAKADYGSARNDIRNKVSHAQPYTAGTDADGNYLPGLSYTAKDGKSWEIISSTPAELIALAKRVEGVETSMHAAWDAVRASPWKDPTT